MEQFALARGWVAGICLAAGASALTSAFSDSSFLNLVFRILRDCLLLLSGFSLLTFGIRSTRRRGLSLRAAAYPVLGIALFGALIAGSIAARRTIRDASNEYGANPPQEMRIHYEAVSRAGCVSAGAAAVSLAAGLLTPIRRGTAVY